MDTSYNEVATPTPLTLEQQRQNHEGDLDEILAGAKRIKNHVKATQNEVAAQDVIIDNLGHNMDRANTEITAQTEVAKVVNNRKKQVCAYYVVIAVLVVALILILTLIP